MYTLNFLAFCAFFMQWQRHNECSLLVRVIAYIYIYIFSRCARTWNYVRHVDMLTCAWIISASESQQHCSHAHTIVREIPRYKFMLNINMNMYMCTHQCLHRPLLQLQSAVCGQMSWLQRRNCGAMRRMCGWGKCWKDEEISQGWEWGSDCDFWENKLLCMYVL